MTGLKPNPDVRVRKINGQWIVQCRKVLDGHAVWCYVGSQASHADAIDRADWLAELRRLYDQG